VLCHIPLPIAYKPSRSTCPIADSVECEYNETNDMEGGIQTEERKGAETKGKTERNRGPGARDGGTLRDDGGDVDWGSSTAGLTHPLRARKGKIETEARAFKDSNGSISFNNDPSVR